MLFLDKEIALGPTDRYIYDYVCKNLDRVVYMRVRELAEACNVYVGPNRAFASEQTVAQMRLLEEATSRLG